MRTDHAILGGVAYGAAQRRETIGSDALWPGSIIVIDPSSRGDEAPVSSLAVHRSSPSPRRWAIVPDPAGGDRPAGRVRRRW
ncbi:conserved hypothetical protein (plasmid) [Thermomicrobium roseum DSM 5159]|uniref:Uncharacterized protein n=1 Tax=Thermomicrobium roseum (strain ATCC 27502 / DSM 5159 / P-2) TaxID=309801 RepID=B9L4E2_THERP|nr:conserved hypothetical protein [Thermomicrobium roseum DSM 5159]